MDFTISLLVSIGSLWEREEILDRKITLTLKAFVNPL